MLLDICIEQCRIVCIETEEKVMGTLENMLDLAWKAHNGQKDRAWEDYTVALDEFSKQFKGE